MRAALPSMGSGSWTVCAVGAVPESVYTLPASIYIVNRQKIKGSFKQIGE
jgi:hypothetical protein